MVSECERRNKRRNEVKSRSTQLIVSECELKNKRRNEVKSRSINGSQFYAENQKVLQRYPYTNANQMKQ